MRTYAAFCHFYPGYTFESVRRMRLRDFSAAVEFMNERQGQTDEEEWN